MLIAVPVAVVSVFLYKNPQITEAVKDILSNFFNGNGGDSGTSNTIERRGSRPAESAEFVEPEEEADEKKLTEVTTSVTPEQRAREFLLKYNDIRLSTTERALNERAANYVMTDRDQVLAERFRYNLRLQQENAMQANQKYKEAGQDLMKAYGHLQKAFVVNKISGGALDILNDNVNESLKVFNEWQKVVCRLRAVTNYIGESGGWVINSTTGARISYEDLFPNTEGKKK